jgi:type I restriction enzyme S subunit
MTQTTTLPDGWIETTLGEVAKVQTGPFGSQLHNSDYVDAGTPMITVEHIVNDKIYHAPNIPKVKKADKERLSKYILREGDIVFSRVGSVDRSAFVSSNEDGWMFSGRLLRVRSNKELISSHYLHYYLTTKSTKKYIIKIAVGATMPSINTSILSGISVRFPPLPQQKAIAKILSAFNDKIELLREQNKTLEETAQTIFKEWFEGGLGGKKVNISEIIIFNPIEKINRKAKYLFFDMKSLSTNSMVMSEGIFKQSNSGTSFRVGDTLFAKITPCLENGKTAYVLDLKGEKVARGSTEFIVMRGKVEGSKYLNYCLSRSPKFREYAIKSMTGTSGRQRVPVARLKTYQIQVKRENIYLFDDLVATFFEKIKNNSQQIELLSKTRNTLLPKLMKGDIRVNI